MFLFLGIDVKSTFDIATFLENIFGSVLQYSLKYSTVAQISFQVTKTRENVTMSEQPISFCS